MIILQILLYILFNYANFYLLFLLPKKYPHLKTLKILAIGFGASSLLMIVGLFLFMIISGYNWRLRIYEQNVISFLMGIIALFMSNLLISFFTNNMIDGMADFHLTKNAENIHRQPLKFFFKNIDSIKHTYRLAFFLGGFIVYWGVIFGTE